jgi:sulfur-oxidizing protein SoxY
LFGQRQILPGTGVIGLDTPKRALDAAVVPVEISAKLTQTPERHIRKMYLVIDNNPSPVAAIFEFPGDRTWEIIATRIRVNAYTDVRVLAELNTGDIYMTSNYVKASGGCSAPALKDPAAAAALLGRMKLYTPEGDKAAGALTKLLIKHPNSSGLQFDQISRNFIPADYVRDIRVSYKDQPLFKVATNISISEDPAISFDFLQPGQEGALRVEVSDSKGRQFNKSFDLTPVQ